MKNVYVRMAAAAGASAQPVMEERIIAVVYCMRLQFECVFLCSSSSFFEHTLNHSTWNAEYCVSSDVVSIARNSQTQKLSGRDSLSVIPVFVVVCVMCILAHNAHPTRR